ncbi:response regulator [Oscillatoria amoena NRMC-F 0135]|nr:response regulator [Oscillatoria amoena NRMC-F 0135]
METEKVNFACLIDDDLVHAFIVEKMLQKTPECTNLLVFPDGGPAIEYFKSMATNADKLPDVIFLDIKMPVVDGWGFLEEFAKIKDSLAKKVRIYMLSSSKNPVDIEKAKSYGEVTDYLTKPISLNQYYSIFKQTA